MKNARPVFNPLVSPDMIGFTNVMPTNPYGPDVVERNISKEKGLSYFPNYFVEHPDKMVLSFIDNVRVNNDDPTYGNELNEMANDHYYGNGTPQGQYGRLQSMT